MIYMKKNMMSRLEVEMIMRLILESEEESLTFPKRFDVFFSLWERRNEVPSSYYQCQNLFVQATFFFCKNYKDLCRKQQCLLKFVMDTLVEEIVDNWGKLDNGTKNILIDSIACLLEETRDCDAGVEAAALLYCYALEQELFVKLTKAAANCGLKWLLVYFRIFAIMNPDESFSQATLLALDLIRYYVLSGATSEIDSFVAMIAKESMERVKEEKWVSQLGFDEEFMEPIRVYCSRTIENSTF